MYLLDEGFRSSPVFHLIQWNCLDICIENSDFGVELSFVTSFSIVFFLFPSEIAFVRYLSNTYGLNSIQSDVLYQNFNSYYMGYYIHSCCKMSYKSQYGPAYLACSETYNWIPIKHCIQLLNQLKLNNHYTRFSSLSSIDVNSIPVTMDIDTLDSHIYFYINSKEDFMNHTPVSLYNLRSYLNKQVIPIFREW
ncbi:unnamed protein product, partial [Schistosoma mattheei]